MSKYYKAEDVIRAIEEMQNGYNGWSDTFDKAQIIGVLEELPPIEVPSEDAVKGCDKVDKRFSEDAISRAEGERSEDERSRR